MNEMLVHPKYGELPNGSFSSWRTVEIEDAGRDDECAPPKKSVLAECFHCGKRFRTSHMFFGWKEGISTANAAPLWWCPTPGCDGAGYCFDIHPIKNLKKSRRNSA